ncbi:MAG: helix-turn-helix domain-containing protein [Lachnospiraceae bacterium]|nr:helix-turn-helix domain-containing protein [Lachnospiraceae bacterium]
MSKIDFEYVVRALAELSGVPVRLYEGEKLIVSQFPVQLPRDPAAAHLKEILSVRTHVGYYVTPLFHYYGILNAAAEHPEKTLVVGPTSQIMAGEQELKALAFQTDVPPEEIPAFLAGMKSIRPLPVETLLQMLCTVNHFLNGGETLSMAGVAISSDVQESLKARVEKRRTERVYEELPAARESHNTLALEETLMDLIRRGDTAALKSWMAAVPGVKGGTIAPTQLRQLRNMFIVSVTLASRAAIRGGLNEDDAFSLSDGYIQRVELLADHSRIMNLQYSMILEFTEQVEKLRLGGHPTKLAADVANYVRHHLSEPIRTEAMAEAFYMSRPYLSARFRQETGMTLSEYVLHEKTEEAKRLLRYSDRSAAAIGAFLGFSSHGHFIRVFKKATGLTPGEYRENHGR